MGGHTNFHGHTNVDWVCEDDLTPEVYAGALGDELRRAVIVDHGFMFYWYDRDIVFEANWMLDPALFEQRREWGNARVAQHLARIRGLQNPCLFAGIETDWTRYGMLTHDARFNDEFDVIIGSVHFMPWLKPDMTEQECIRVWLPHVEQMLFAPELDIFGHPMRMLLLRTQVRHIPDDIIARLAALIEESGITTEINVPKARNQIEAYQPALARLVRRLADRGLPLVFSTDSHAKSQIADFSRHLDLLQSLGLSETDLNMPEVEDFTARKGRRHLLASRPGKKA
ncbi:MAG: hypothetical protein JXR37_04935 [Kiritimatiellae bacterium]|nr:hypothetical protein [Kiritimatiellia bacterium]